MFYLGDGVIDIFVVLRTPNEVLVLDDHMLEGNLQKVALGLVLKLHGLVH